MWALVALGVLLAIIAVLSILRPMLALQKRTESLPQAQLLLDLAQLRERNDELARIPARLDALGERMKRVQRSLDVSIRMLKLPQAMAALRGAGLAIRALAKALHFA